MIRSQARQRTTPWTAGIGPSSTIRRRKALCVSSSLGGAPGEGMLMRPSGPCWLNRITQSRNVWRAKDGAQARRLLALAAVLDGVSREEAARLGGIDSS